MFCLNTKIRWDKKRNWYVSVNLWNELKKVWVRTEKMAKKYAFYFHLKRKKYLLADKGRNKKNVEHEIKSIGLKITNKKEYQFDIFTIHTQFFRMVNAMGHHHQVHHHFHRIHHPHHSRIYWMTMMWTYRALVILKVVYFLQMTSTKKNRIISVFSRTMIVLRFRSIRMMKCWNV